VLLVSLLACARTDKSAPDAGEPREAAAAVDAGTVDAGLAPLSGHPWQFDLMDGKKNVATVSVPLGAREPRPILVALHGGSDKPGWACGEWRAVTNAYPFIVCPRGLGAESGLYWGDPAYTKQAIERALEMTKAMFGPYVRESPIVLVGFSMGATQTSLLSREDPKRFARVALSENAYDPKVVSDFAARYRGERVLWSCTTFACEPTYRAAATTLAKRGVRSRVNVAGTNAHGIWDDTVRSIRRDWPWLVEGLEGWEAYVPPVEDKPPPGKTLPFEPP
jgi:hypothetical protein